METWQAIEENTSTEHLYLFTAERNHDSLLGFNAVLIGLDDDRRVAVHRRLRGPDITSLLRGDNRELIVNLLTGSREFHRPPRVVKKPIGIVRLQNKYGPPIIRSQRGMLPYISVVTFRVSAMT